VLAVVDGHRARQIHHTDLPKLAGPRDDELLASINTPSVRS
jgi:hypothetical protein